MINRKNEAIRMVAKEIITLYVPRTSLANHQQSKLYVYGTDFSSVFPIIQPSTKTRAQPKSSFKELKHRMLRQKRIIIISLMEQTVSTKIKQAAITYQNFPKPGVNFIDIFPIVSNPATYQLVIDSFANRLKDVQYSKIFMLESKGFLFGPALSLKVLKPCYPIRKKGKLPGQCQLLNYDLEYGFDTIEIQKSLVKQGDKVVLLDDVLATGGTLNAAIRLIEKLGGKVQCIVLLSHVKKLGGLQRLSVPKEKIFTIYED